MKAPSEQEFLDLVIETLNLNADIKITLDTLLFSGELGLNSIDALEVGAVVNERYGIELKPKDDATREAMASVRTLHAYVVGQMKYTLEESETNAA